MGVLRAVPVSLSAPAAEVREEETDGWAPSVA